METTLNVNDLESSLMVTEKDSKHPTVSLFLTRLPMELHLAIASYLDLDALINLNNALKSGERECFLIDGYEPELIVEAALAACEWTIRDQHRRHGGHLYSWEIEERSEKSRRFMKVLDWLDSRGDVQFNAFIDAFIGTAESPFHIFVCEILCRPAWYSLVDMDKTQTRARIHTEGTDENISELRAGIKEQGGFEKHNKTTFTRQSRLIKLLTPILEDYGETWHSLSPNPIPYFILTNNVPIMALLHQTNLWDLEQKLWPYEPHCEFYHDSYPVFFAVWDPAKTREALSFLLDHGADVDHESDERGRMRPIHHLLNIFSYDTNLQQTYQWTATQWLERVKTLRYLLRERGMNPNHNETLRGWSPLDICFDHEWNWKVINELAVLTLLENGATVEGQGWAITAALNENLPPGAVAPDLERLFHPLHQAVDRNRHHLLSAWLKAGANINLAKEVDELRGYGRLYSPLYRAIANLLEWSHSPNYDHSLKTVKLLVEWGADVHFAFAPNPSADSPPEMQETDSMSPVQLAAKYGLRDFVEAMLPGEENREKVERLMEEARPWREWKTEGRIKLMERPVTPWEERLDKALGED